MPVDPRKPYKFLPMKPPSWGDLADARIAAGAAIKRHARAMGTFRSTLVLTSMVYMFLHIAFTDMGTTLAYGLFGAAVGYLAMLLMRAVKSINGEPGDAAIILPFAVVFGSILTIGEAQANLGRAFVDCGAAFLFLGGTANYFCSWHKGRAAELQNELDFCTEVDADKHASIIKKVKDAYMANPDVMHYFKKVAKLERSVTFGELEAIVRLRDPAKSAIEAVEELANSNTELDSKTLAVAEIVMNVRPHTSCEVVFNLNPEACPDIFKKYVEQSLREAGLESMAERFITTAEDCQDVYSTLIIAAQYVKISFRGTTESSAANADTKKRKYPADCPVALGMTKNGPYEENYIPDDELPHWEEA